MIEVDYRNRFTITCLNLTPNPAPIFTVLTITVDRVRLKEIISIPMLVIDIS